LDSGTEDLSNPWKDLHLDSGQSPDLDAKSNIVASLASVDMHHMRDTGNSHCHEGQLT